MGPGTLVGVNQNAAADVDFVRVHGTGTYFNDAAEAAALGLVFGEPALRLPLHAAKPAVGHTLGAAGALESLFALSALERGVLPASASAGTPMAGLPAYLLERNLAAPVEHCLKLSTAFGGANAALVQTSIRVSLLADAQLSGCTGREPLLYCAPRAHVIARGRAGEPRAVRRNGPKLSDH